MQHTQVSQTPSTMSPSRPASYTPTHLSSLRLRSLEPYPASGTITAQTYGNRCFEIGDGVASSRRVGNNSEDCLVLNVYTPGRSEDEKGGLDLSLQWPVMVYVHGGGFNQGSGNDYKGQSLVNRSVELQSPVVVVMISYRLDFFGFLAGADAVANNAVNLGFLDQRFALQWVHDSIAAFGGDPGKVTIFDCV
ncbi:alpha/beta-hydrolase [Hyaloscypha variabilis F]|uniref:Alpha/beta-hydrolase n=1 Tax=Hyaloscypha variabilis (strain UAMH 11265 / GT02V1 / F) TaxID=1149755 RepID=A0A2J6QTC7_HYAVF|nr:alpha/beta-hydrolase [Hyaloscypha variabilis F]